MIEHLQLKIVFGYRLTQDERHCRLRWNAGSQDTLTKDLFGFDSYDDRVSNRCSSIRDFYYHSVIDKDLLKYTG